MPAFAPRSSVMAERQRGADARQAHMPGRITIAGITYDAMLHLGPVEPAIDSGTGAAHIAQRGEAHVQLSALRSAPKRDTVVSIAGVDYLVESASASLHAPVWVVKFYRLPPAA